jgi:hypothetical protein
MMKKKRNELCVLVYLYIERETKIKNERKRKGRKKTENDAIPTEKLQLVE